MPTKKQIASAMEFQSTAGKKHSGKYVAYYRVSTQKQSLGLAAQETIVQNFLNGGSWQLINCYIEKESGRKSLKDRPQLEAAIAECKEKGATLLVARLDRLSRSVAFVSALQDTNLKFTICDMPHLSSDNPQGRMMLNIMASVAEYEAKIISERTVNSLAEINTTIKKRKKHLAKTSNKYITKLGSGDPTIGARAAAEVRKKAADDFVKENRERVLEITKMSGGSSLRGIAKLLTKFKIKTPRGNDKWSASQVRNFLERCK